MELKGDHIDVVICALFHYIAKGQRLMIEFGYCDIK